MKDLTPLAPVAVHFAETRLEQRLHFGERPVGDDEDLQVVRPQPALRERRKIVAVEPARSRAGSPPGGPPYGWFAP